MYAGAGFMLNLHVLLTCLADNLETKWGWDWDKVRRRRRNLSSFFLGLNSNQLCRRKIQTGAIRKKNVWKSSLSKKTLINCFVTQRCRVKGFYPVVLTFNPFTNMSKTADMHFFKLSIKDKGALVQTDLCCCTIFTIVPGCIFTSAIYFNKIQRDYIVLLNFRSQWLLKCFLLSFTSVNSIFIFIFILHSSYKLNR